MPWGSGTGVDTAIPWAVSEGSLQRGWGGCAVQNDGTNLLNFLDVTVLVIGGDGLGGLDALIVLEQGCDLRQKHRSAAGRGGSQQAPRGEGCPALPPGGPGTAAQVPRSVGDQ